MDDRLTPIPESKIWDLIRKYEAKRAEEQKYLDKLLFSNPSSYAVSGRIALLTTIINDLYEVLN